MQELHHHRFENGLTLVAERMDWLESAAFAFAVSTGGVHDPEDRLGLANLTCEMAQRGCGEYSSREFIEALDRLGAERSSHAGAVHTIMSASCLADNLIPVLSIHAELVRRPHLAEDQLEDARAVCLQELQSMEDDPAQKTMRRLRQEAYGDPWGRSSQGEFESLTGMNIGDVRQFHQRHYSPQGAILGVAGKFDWLTLRDAVGDLWGSWHGDRNPQPPVAPVAPVNVHVPHDSSQTQVSVAFQSVPFRDERYLLARAAVGVLSDGMSSRLFTTVREERGLCYTVFAHHHSFYDGARIFCYAGTTKERAQETLDVVLAELTRLTEGVDESELSRLKARTKSALIMQQESSLSRCSSLVGDWYHLGRLRTMDELNAKIDALSCEAINQYLRDHPAADFTVVTLGEQALEVRVGISA